MKYIGDHYEDYRYDHWFNLIGVFKQCLKTCLISLYHILRQMSNRIR